MPETSTATRRDRVIDALLWVAAGLLVVGTVVLSLFVDPPSSRNFGQLDDVEHFLSYFGTTLCLLLAAVWRPGRGDGIWPSRALAIGAALFLGGVTIEVLQGMSGTRQAQVSDAVADALGVGCALLLHRVLRSRSRVTDSA
jgi:VanZ family protein